MTNDILRACVDVEKQYNYIQSLYMSNDYSQEMDDRLELAREDYYLIIKYINELGIGGVLINGTFRTTESD